jgi:hypothetical protein
MTWSEATAVASPWMAAGAFALSGDRYAILALGGAGVMTVFIGVLIQALRRGDERGN